ncbi:MAG: wax ester/triacylglycerol synthase family O-acyltransferase [Nevskia sp.]|nr:wax ester/triacylglycerol synthase family O-acyltransferase [Nevskia sp.]
MTTSTTFEPVNAVDRAWLDMDEPHNPMVISAVFQLEGPVDAANLQKVMVERLLRYPRFGQRIDYNRRQPVWVNDPELDFRYHVHVRRLPDGAPERELRKAISAEVSRELDSCRPLWRLFLFPRSDGPVTVLFRAHHALADGLALVTLLIDSTDAGFRRAPELPLRPAAKPSRPGPLGGIIDRLESVNDGLLSLSAMLGADGDLGPVRRQYQEGRAAMAAVRRVLALPDDNPPALRKPLSGRRGVAWTGELPLEPIRRQARLLHVRVNDLLMAALAGAFGRQLQHGSASLAPEQGLRISVPVNLRTGKGRDLGNRFGLVLLDLPVGEADPWQRLNTVAQRMSVLKESGEARAIMLGLAAAGRLPMPLERRLVNLIGSRSVAVVSSLPGPKRHVRIAGARMRDLVFWPPQSGGIGLGLSFFSYAGQLSFGVSADLALLPNPRGLLDAFEMELERLLQLKRPAATSSTVQAGAEAPQRMPLPEI